jgi:hypothetical protein
VALSHYGRCGRSRGNARTGADEIAAVPPEATVRGAAIQDVLDEIVLLFGSCRRGASEPWVSMIAVDPDA